MQAIFEKYQGNGINCSVGTDKGSAHSYTRVYEEVLPKFQHDPVRILEIGICSGGSLMAWSEFFTHPRAEIVGIDLTLRYVCFNITDPRVKMLVADGTKEDTADFLGQDWDIVIDDGSHSPFDQATSMQIFGKRLRPGGVYVIEDILDIKNAFKLCELGETAFGWKGTVHDLRHVKGDQADVIIVFQKPSA